MKRLLIVPFFLFPFFLAGQNLFQVGIGTQSGFEYNVFNANKNKIIITEDGDSTSAVQSAFFQHINFQVGWKKKFKRHQLSAKARTRLDYFPTLTKANLLRPSLKIDYAYKFNKRSSFFIKNEYLKYQTNRIPDETEVLSVPNGYQRWQSNIGYKFKPIKNNKSQLQFIALKKQYVPDENSELRYRSLGLNFRTSQRFKQKGHPSRYLTFEIDWTRRHYFDEPFEEDDEEELEIKERIWEYRTAKVEYSFAHVKSLRWKTGLMFQQRIDVLDEKFGYHQLQPYVKIEYKKDKLTLGIKLEMIFRNFSNIKAGKVNDELLKHQYLRSSFRVRYELNDHWELAVQGNWRNRWRNQSTQATSFLPYANGLLSVGVNYRF